MVPTFDTRVDADKAVQDGESVCAALLKDGSPRYFCVPSDTTEPEMRRLAFDDSMCLLASAKESNPCMARLGTPSIWA